MLKSVCHWTPKATQPNASEIVAVACEWQCLFCVMFALRGARIVIAKPNRNYKIHTRVRHVDAMALAVVGMTLDALSARYLRVFAY